MVVIAVVIPENQFTGFFIWKGGKDGVGARR
jgi:hypothetical protein